MIDPASGEIWNLDCTQKGKYSKTSTRIHTRDLTRPKECLDSVLCPPPPLRLHQRIKPLNYSFSLFPCTTEVKGMFAIEFHMVGSVFILLFFVSCLQHSLLMLQKVLFKLWLTMRIILDLYIACNANSLLVVL